MHSALLVILLVFLALAFETGNTWLSYLIGFLILGDLAAGILLGVFKAGSQTKRVLGETASSEFREMENSSPKPPSGKKFFEEGLSRTGKGLGKGDRAMQEGKKIRDSRGAFQQLGDSASAFMDGLKGLFNR